MTDLLGSCGSCATRIGERGGQHRGDRLALLALCVPLPAAKGPCACIKDAGQVTAVCQAQPWSGRAQARTLVVSPLWQEAMVRVRDWADVRSGGCGKPPTR